MSVQHRMESQRGTIGRDLRSGVKNGQPWANFSMAVDINRRGAENQWEKVGVNWYTVSCFNALARNVAASLRPGAPVVVTGLVEHETRLMEDEAGQPRIAERMTVRADMVAPDLSRTEVMLPDTKPRADIAHSSMTSEPTAQEATAWPEVRTPGGGMS